METSEIPDKLLTAWIPLREAFPAVAAERVRTWWHRAQRVYPAATVKAWRCDGIIFAAYCRSQQLSALPATPGHGDFFGRDFQMHGRIDFICARRNGRHHIARRRHEEHRRTVGGDLRASGLAIRIREIRFAADARRLPHPAVVDEHLPHRKRRRHLEVGRVGLERYGGRLR